MKKFLPCGAERGAAERSHKKAGFGDSAAESKDLGGQSDEFVFTVPELETVTELHKVGTAGIPGVYLRNSAGLPAKRRSPSLLHTNGISGRKPKPIA